MPKGPVNDSPFKDYIAPKKGPRPSDNRTMADGDLGDFGVIGVDIAGPKDLLNILGK